MRADVEEQVNSLRRLTGEGIEYPVTIDPR
ncbi:hypothetical protein JOD24_000283 [Kroppenstedtia sanguinis]